MSLVRAISEVQRRQTDDRLQLQLAWLNSGLPANGTAVNGDVLGMPMQHDGEVAGVESWIDVDADAATNRVVAYFLRTIMAMSHVMRNVM